MEEIELVKKVDEQGNQVGEVERTEGIEHDILMQAVQLWIINPYTKQVLMQQRSFNKENDPGLIDASVSGHVKVDENSYEAILREANEELGIDKSYLSRQISEIGNVEVDFSKHGSKGRYITREYLAFIDKPLDFYTLQEEEVDHLLFMPYEEVKKAIINRDPIMRIPYTDETKRLFKIIDTEIEKYLENNREKE